MGLEAAVKRPETERRGGFEKNRGVCHLSYGELLDRRAKGLCFRCGEKFSPTHRCSGSLRLIVLSDDERVDEQGEIVALEVEDVEEEGGLECNSLGLLGVHNADLKGAKTMRLAGSVEGISLMVLVDSGASHNFIAPSVVSALGLRVDESHKLGVRLGDGHQVWTKGMCGSLPLKLNKEEFVVDAFVLELGEIDVILGMEWLETLGTVIMDWAKMTMVFNHFGREIKLGRKTEAGNNSTVNDPSCALQSLLGTGVRQVNGVLWNLDVEHGQIEKDILGQGQQRELNIVLEKFP